MVVWQDIWLDGGSNVFCESNDRSNLSLLKFIISLTTRFYLIHFSPASVLPSWLIDCETYISSSTTTESTYHFFSLCLHLYSDFWFRWCCVSQIVLQSNHASRWQRNLCNACIDELNPPSDGGKHCSSWWVSLSFKKFYPLAVSEAITTPHMPHELIPPPKTVSSGCRPEQHSSACLSVGATCRWQTRWWYHQNHEEAMWWRHCCQYKLLGVAAAIGTK